MRRSYVLTGVTALAIVAVGLLWLGRGKTGGPCPLEETAPPEMLSSEHEFSMQPDGAFQAPIA